MNCESGAVSGVRECASGECSKHILIFEHFRWIRICYVFHGQSATRKFCDQKSIVFIVSDCNNRSATAGFFCHCLQNPCRNQKHMRPSTDLARARFNPTNISSRASRAISMTVSDGDGQRQNKQYCFGFIGARDGRAEGTFSEINARTAHMRRRPCLGQTWYSSGVL